jgi:hypothetical protein
MARLASVTGCRIPAEYGVVGPHLGDAGTTAARADLFLTGSLAIAARTAATGLSVASERGALQGSQFTSPQIINLDRCSINRDGARKDGRGVVLIEGDKEVAPLSSGFNGYAL